MNTITSSSITSPSSPYWAFVQWRGISHLMAAVPCKNQLELWNHLRMWNNQRLAIQSALPSLQRILWNHSPLCAYLVCA